MCTNFVLIKKNGVADLANRLGVDEHSLIYGDFRPSSQISIIREKNQQREALEATWWLYLQQTEHGLKPHPDYFSVNTNHAKLNNKTEYKKTRCIILASAFVESQGGKRPHLLEPDDGSAIAFGGLYKEWTDRTTGEVIHSASIITLAGHPALANIHRKSTPLWLPEDQYDNWLNPDMQKIENFSHLLNPTLHKHLKATPIDKVMNKKQVSPSFIIS